MAQHTLSSINTMMGGLTDHRGCPLRIGLLIIHPNTHHWLQYILFKNICQAYTVDNYNLGLSAGSSAIAVSIVRIIPPALAEFSIDDLVTLTGSMIPASIKLLW